MDLRHLADELLDHVDEAHVLAANIVIITTTSIMIIPVCTCIYMYNIYIYIYILP